MTKKSFPLSRVYRLLEPGSVVLVTTAHKDNSENRKYRSRIVYAGVSNAHENRNLV